MSKIIGFIILSLIKTFSHVFFRGNFKWVGPTPKNPWKEARLIIFLNHTSLYEPIYIQNLSYPYLWKFVSKLTVPGADITLNRPIVGRFWKLMFPNISSVTRKKDNSWSAYLQRIKSDSLILMAPEGRMKRPTGLDKNGKPMTVRGGAADVLENLHEGKMILLMSGGLHHIQSPGQHFPRLFRTIDMNLFCIDINDYKAQFPGSARERKIKITQDLQRRLENDCPNIKSSTLMSSSSHQTHLDPLK